MIAKFAIMSGKVSSEFLDLNHTSKSLFLVSLMIPKFAPVPAASFGELRNRDTSWEHMAPLGGEYKPEERAS